MLLGLIYVLNSVQRDKEGLSQPIHYLQQDVIWVLKSWLGLIVYIHITFVV